jgi:hypothetical protein
VNIRQWRWDFRDPSRLAPRTTQPPVQQEWISYLAVKWPGYDVNHPPLSSITVEQMGWSNTSATPLCLHSHVMGWPSIFYMISLCDLHLTVSRFSVTTSFIAQQIWYLCSKCSPHVCKHSRIVAAAYCICPMSSGKVAGNNATIWLLLSSGLLRSIGWLSTDFSGQCRRRKNSGKPWRKLTNDGI